MLVLVPDLHFADFFIDHIQQKPVYQRPQIFLDLFPVDAAVNIQNKGLVILYRLEDLQKSLLPRFISLFLIQRSLGILQARPFHKIVNILEVVIKGHAVDTAVLGNVIDGNFGQRFFQQQILQ